MGRQVKRTVKDSNGDVTKLCGVWGSVDKDVAVRRIDADPEAYFVEEESPRVYVRVVEVNSDKYLRTEADSTSKNNLENLPECRPADIWPPSVAL